MALALPLLALAYAAGLLFFQLQTVYAYAPVMSRLTNNVLWDSEFSDGQSLDGFPSNTRHLIRQGMYQ